ncbi:HTH domain-containing protein [Paenibacillus sp. MDMC362]|uniref:HTH domain-containing protein n=1 Tax=Paenibacillus sp. MDMC362 TaxID=2977365 RepID=UPI0021A74751|nr:HTH domain-containing protein [Paenibacillus sp. MDMC362]
MSKADNMLAMLWLLKSRRKMTAKQLSEELGVHIRTVYRCIDARLGAMEATPSRSISSWSRCFLRPMSKRRFFTPPHSRGKRVIHSKSRLIEPFPK